MPLASYDDFIDYVRPELLRRGRTWDDYQGATLREYVRGRQERGSDDSNDSDSNFNTNARVAADHPAASAAAAVKADVY